MKRSKAPFKKALGSRSRANKLDAVGDVQVRIIHVERGVPTKGNISLTFTITGARVSEVYDFLHRASFGEDTR